MPTISRRMADIAIAQGYDGPLPTTTKQATIALADALSGGAAGDATTISDAIGKLGEHIGGGGSSGGGATSAPINKLVLVTAQTNGRNDVPTYVSETNLSTEDVNGETAICTSALLYGGEIYAAPGAHVTMIDSIPESPIEASITLVDSTTWETVEQSSFTDYTLEVDDSGKSSVGFVRFVVPTSSDGTRCEILFKFGNASA